MQGSRSSQRVFILMIDEGLIDYVVGTTWQPKLLYK